MAIGARKPASVLADSHEGKPGHIAPDHFLADLHCTATYIFEQGLPFFVSSHTRFMRAYLEAWQKQTGDEVATDAFKVLDAFSANARHNLHPMLFLVTGFVHSVASSAWLALSRSIRVVPPLITALVIVYVTGDAWRILATGFTPRFFCIVTLFLVSSLLFLVRFRGYWEKDFDIDESGACALLDQIKHELQGKRAASKFSQQGAAAALGGQQRDVDYVSEWEQFHTLVCLGAEPLPLVKPASRGLRISHYCSYVAVSFFSLIVLALAVSASLILVGLVLISAKETKVLSQSAHVYLTLPGNLVVTRQLLSLSFTLGAFAVFFLVAGQRAEDRRELMDNALALVRRAFVAYSVYSRAHDHAAEWTGVPIESPPLAPDPREPGRQDLHPAASTDARSQA